MLGRRFLSVVAAALTLAASTTAVFTDWEKIHSVIHTYPMYVDAKDFSQLKHTFTQDAIANYTGKLSDLNGLKEIEHGLANDTKGVTTQHQLGTTVISINPHFVLPSSGSYKNQSRASCGKANSTTYVQVMRFAAPYHNGEHVTIFGKYVDKFEKIGISDWKICDRKFFFSGPGHVGNKTLLGLIGR